MRFGPTSRLGRALLLTGAGLLALASLALALAVALNFMEDPLRQGRPDRQLSVRVEDRQGRLLRELLSRAETRSEWVGLEHMTPYLVSALIAAEDTRFFRHHGVDPPAIVRAFSQNLKAGRIVSGASTITMQLARILSPGPRSFGRKLIQALSALKIETGHSKEEILEEYLNRVPCGNLVYGIPAAARLYFGKSTQTLSPAEAAFLVALPQAPSAMNPFKRSDLALGRRNHILKRMALLGFLSSPEAARAVTEPLNLNDYQHSFHAPHFVDYIRSTLPKKSEGVVKTTLDIELQEQIENLTRQTVDRNRDRGITQAAVLVMDHRTREVLAWVGSYDFFDTKEGQNSGVTSLRQPGSTVKPFTYAVALDSGLTPATVIDDRPIDFGLDRGVYSPSNYDDRFHGEVPLRTALASSLNVPAVKVLSQVGLGRVYDKMKAAGLTSLTEEPDFYGLGLTLGCGDVTLLELANAYATLAQGGLFREPVLFLPQSQPDQPTPAKTRRVFSPQAAYLITDILSDDTARATGFGRDSLLDMPFPCAAKTGTSKNFRDNWTVGYTSSIVVAVWAGNFDARPMGLVSGISGAGPLWRQVMRLVSTYYPPEPFPKPNGLTEKIVCSDTGLLAGKDCPNTRIELFMENHTPSGYCLLHKSSPPDFTTVQRRAPGLAILSPRNHERYLYDPGIEPGYQNLYVTAQTQTGVDCLIWYVNGQEKHRMTPEDNKTPELFWPLEKGQITFKLVGMSQGRVAAADEVTIMVY